MAISNPPGYQTGSVNTKSGASIHFQHFHRTHSELCIVLLHSLAMDHTFWRLVAPTLAKDVSVVCIDVRGHGQSGKPQGPYSIALFAQDVKAVIDALGYKKVLVAGASMGGCISLQFALDYPELSAGLGLFDTTSWYGPKAPEDWKERANKARTDGFASMAKFQTTRWFGDEFRARNPALVQECIDIFVANDLEAYCATCEAMGAFNVQNRLSQINIPTAILVGADDYATPVEMAQHLHNSISGSSLKVIPQARHLTPLETPHVIIETLVQLLSLIKTASKS